MAVKFLITIFALSLIGGITSAKETPDFIRAEVSGTLQKTPRGVGMADIYYIVVKEPPFNDEDRVWLTRAEDKRRDLDRKLNELAGKKVAAKGPLNSCRVSIPVVPAGGFCMLGFEIEAR